MMARERGYSGFHWAGLVVALATAVFGFAGPVGAQSNSPAPVSPLAQSSPASPSAPASPPSPTSPPAAATPVPANPGPDSAPAPAPQAQSPGAPEQGSTAEPQPEQSVVTVELPSRPVLMMRGKAKWDDGFEIMTGAFAKLRAEAKRLELTEGGKPLTIFLESDDESFTFEAMLPLGSDPGAKQPGDGFSFGKNPGGKAMKFEHRGAYAEIEVTYEAITAFLDEKGLLAQDAFIEEYLTEPKSAEDTSLAVDIYVFLK